MLIKYRGFSIPVVFEDRHVLVVVKPAGLTSQIGSGHDYSLVEAVRQYFSQKEARALGEAGQPFVGTVHRLDKVVSGLMVFAKTPGAARSLSAAIRNQLVVKEYVAVVCGSLSGSHSRVVENLVSPSNQPERGQFASLELHPIHPFQYSQPSFPSPHSLTAVKVALHTGRKHQIRSQLSNLQLPVFADRKYGARFWPMDPASQQEIALYSYRLQFPHPDRTLGVQTFRIPPPLSWRRWFGRANMEECMQRLQASWTEE